jgi:hypothetical protein
VSKDNYGEAIKLAREHLYVAYKVYRFEVRKQKLLRKQAKLSVRLELMGVVRKQIPVIIKESRTYNIPVRIGATNGTISVSN